MHRLTEELSRAGFNTNAVADKVWHRFPDGKDDDKESGYYKAFQNFTSDGGEPFYVMIYGSWRDGKPPTVYNTHANRNLNKLDKDRVREQIRQAQRDLHVQREAAQKKAAAHAVEKFNKLSESFGPNAYLARKGITELYGARLDGAYLVIPMRDAAGEIKNLETVSPDGIMKKGLYGGQRSGLFHQIGEVGDVIYIVEGFSTGVAVFKVMREAVFVCFNSGNLVTASKEIFKKYPGKKFIVCGDNDQFPNKLGVVDNVGVAKAQEAANVIGGKFVIPEFKSLVGEPTDWDDLLRVEGADAVEAQIEAVNPTEVAERYDVQYVTHAPYPDENEKGVRKGTMLNVAELLRRLRVVVRYNVISKEEEILVPDGVFSMDNKANATLAYTVDWCVRVGIPTDNLSAYLTAIADSRPYNPVATWIDSVPWDEESRLEDFYETITSTDETMKRKLIRKWMISAVAAAYEPNGVCARGVLVLQGKQNMGKTHWFKKLVPEHLELIQDGVLLRPDDKDSVFQIVSKWINELGELDATFRKSDIAQLKGFVSKQRDTLRRPYSKKESNYARRTVFFGSVNEDDYLRDPTGNTRFWTIACTYIDHHHSLNMQQVWAEFAALYKAGESWHLDEETLEALNGHNEAHVMGEAIDDRIRTLFEGANVLMQPIKKSAGEICLMAGIHNPTNQDCQGAARTLKKMFGEPKKSNGRKVYSIPIPSGYDRVG